MRVLVLLDPIATLRPTSDTSIVLIDEFLSRGHTVAICELQDLWLQGAKPKTRYHLVEKVNRLQAPALTVFSSEEGFVGDFHAVLIRKDPPFDQNYLWATQMLELARDHVFLFNDPKGLREANEKLYIFHFPELIAPTLVTRQISDIQQFLQEQGGQLVLKPLDGFGGSGIFHIRADDPNTRVILETMTQEEKRWVMIQRYLPEARFQGDKRILLLEGKPVGALLRLPQGYEVRSNLRAGGQAHATELTNRDYEICETIAPRLLQDGLHFVGLDVIGGFVTEVNVTSPTGVQAMNRLYNMRLEKRIVDFIEQSAETSDT